MKMFKHIPMATLPLAENLIRDAFFKLASDNGHPLPDRNFFVFSYPCKAPKKFNMDLHVTLEGSPDALSFRAVAICSENRMPYLKVTYEPPTLIGQ